VKLSRSLSISGRTMQKQCNWKEAGDLKQRNVNTMFRCMQFCRSWDKVVVFVWEEKCLHKIVYRRTIINSL